MENTLLRILKLQIQKLRKVGHTLAVASMADATKKRYASGLKHWQQFVNVWNQPIYELTPDILETYVSFRAAHSAHIGDTVAGEISAIKKDAQFRRIAVPNEAQLAFMRMQIEGLRRLRPAKGGMDTLSLDAVVAYANYLERTHGPHDFGVRMMIAALSAALFAMMRISAYVVKSSLKESPLQIHQVKWLSTAAKPVAVGFSRNKSKMNQRGRAELSPLVCSCHLGLCAFHAFVAYWAQRTQMRTTNSAVFVLRTGERVTETHIRGWTKAAAKCVGLRGDDYSGQSLRKAGATVAFDLGAKLSDVEYNGDWAQNSEALRSCYLHSSKVRVAQRIFGIKPP